MTAATLLDRMAEALLMAREDASPEWCAAYIAASKDAPHHGDCPHAEHQGPVTCDRCAVEELKREALAVARVVLSEPLSQHELLAVIQRDRRNGEDMYPGIYRVISEERLSALGLDPPA